MTKLLKGTPKDIDLEAHLCNSTSLGAAEAEYLLLNVSANCNYRCTKCCNSVGQSSEIDAGNDTENKKGDTETSETNNKPYSKKRKVTLTLDETKRIISQAKSELGTKVVVMAGEGEPLLAPNFNDIIQYIHDESLTAILFTHAYFLNRKIAEFLRDNDVSLIISCDSLIPERYNKLVGVKAFERVIQNIKDTAEIYIPTKRVVRSYGNTESNSKEFEIYRIAFNTVISNINLDELDSIQQFCREKGIMSIFNYPLLKGTILGHRDEMVASASEWKKQKEIAKEKSDNKGFSGITYEGNCGYLFHGLSIGIDGSILAPCAYCPENEGILGDIRDYINIKNGFVEANRMVKEGIRELSAKHGTIDCLPRHEKYQEYLDNIKKNRRE